MSHQADSAFADLRTTCQHCGVVFFTRYIEAKYCSVQCRDSAAKKRARLRGKLKKEGLQDSPREVIRNVAPHPIVVQKHREYNAASAAALQAFKATFLACEGRQASPEEQAKYMEQWAIEHPISLADPVEGRETAEEAIRAVMAQSPRETHE